MLFHTFLAVGWRLQLTGYSMVCSRRGVIYEDFDRVAWLAGKTEAFGPKEILTDARYAAALFKRTLAIEN